MKGQDFQGVNAAYVAELYDRYRQDPSSSIAATRAAFDAGLTPDPVLTERLGGDIVDSADVAEVVGAVNLAECIRRYGHLAATLDPLGATPHGDPSLAARIARRLGRRCSARLPASLIGGPIAAGVGQRPRGHRRRCARSTARPPATTSRTSSCPRSATGCATPPKSGRFRPPAQPIDDDRAARSPHPGRGLRAVPAPRLPRQDALLDRRARHADPGPRRDHRRRRRRRHARTC